MPMDHPVRTTPLTEGSADVVHPLDPLSAREIARATAIIRAHFPWDDDLRVETIDIEEPEKELVRNHVQGTPFPRIARFNIYRRGVMGVWQGRVDLESGEVIAKTFRADARAMVAVEEVLLIEKTVKADAALPGGAAPPRPAGRSRQHVHRPVDRGRLRL